MAILKVMVELYHAPNIIQEIKFEVEILTNCLEVEIPCMHFNLTASNVLSDYPILSPQEPTCVLWPRPYHRF